MRILIVTIVPGSAVDRLAEMVQKHNEHLDIRIFPFHAKRYSATDLKTFETMARDVDLIDWEYWRGAQVLMEKFPWLKDKRKILTHHNPYDLHKIDPNLFDAVVVKNKTQQEELPSSVCIPHAVDSDFFKFNEDYCKDCKTVGMVAWRIEGKKGIREVAQVCEDLGYKFILVGKISKPDYFKQFGSLSCLDFRQEIPDEDLRQAYYDMSILVCNSINNYESGPLVVLEAMASGTPVLTREVGLIPDIYDGGNMLIREGQTEDKVDLKSALKSLMEDREWREKMRQNAWRIVKDWDDRRMAMRYAALYNEVMFPTRPLVSVITATYNRKKQVSEIIMALDNQTYPNIELVVADDGSDDGTESVIKDMREKVGYPIKYINTTEGGQIKKHKYGLAKARNMGVIEAEGEMLMFLDSRLLPEKDAISQFMENIGKEKKWLFGDKGGDKRSFVENFSMIRRRYFIQAGMCLERIDRYGGMSQELRERFGSQDFEFVYVPEAKAKEILKAQKFSKKRNDIRAMKFRIWQLGYQRYKT